MKQEQIKQELQRRFKEVCHYYDNMLEDFEVETVHDFRVEIKKLRAFLRLLNAVKISDKTLKIDAGLRDCYHIAGDVRNLQLHRQRIINLCNNFEISVPASYLNLLTTNERLKQQECRKIVRHISLREIEKCLIQDINHKLSDKAIGQYMVQKKKELEAFFLLPYLSDDDLHGLRKMLKDLLYSLGYVKAHINLLPAFFTDKKNIEELANRLGDFYDLCMAVAFLSDDYIEAIEGEEKDLCRKWRQYFEANKTVLKQSIASVLYLAAHHADTPGTMVEIFCIQ